MLTLMIMAQDYTAYEPVTSGVWIQKDKYLMQDKFEELKQQYITGFRQPERTASVNASNECIEKGYCYDIGIIMCGDKVMGSYPYDRAIEIMKDIAERNGKLQSNVEYNTAFDGNEYQNIDYHNAEEWTYYMPQE